MKGAFLSRFTPSLMPSEALEAIFVQRQRDADRTVELIRESVLTPNKSHTLFIGPRGIGKTHLVSLIYHRLRAMEDLREKMLVAWLREEEWGVSSFLDVLQRILRALAEDDPLIELPGQLADTEAAAERVAKATLLEIVGHKTLILLAENLDDLLEGIGDEGQKKFRAFLQDTRFTTILATSQGLFGGVSRQTAPFYNFFRVQHLPILNLDDAVLLLTKIAQLEEDVPLTNFLNTPAGRARVRAVHHLAGGNPRVYVIFSEFLTRDALDELVAPFLKMLDELTPYYQSKMRYLSPQQRKIVEILSDARGAIPVKEIAQRSYSAHQTISSQLVDLREKGYVTQHKVGRESLYELQEPLMRLCLEVKKQRGEPIKLFIDFLRLMYSGEELERRLLTVSPEAKLTHRYLQVAIKQSKGQDNPLVTACLEDYKVFRDQENHEKALQVREELIAIRGEADDWVSKGAHLCDLNRDEEALAAIEQAILLEPKDPIAWFVKGISLANLNRNEEALAAYEQALGLEPSDAATWINKGNSLLRLNREEEALAAYEQSLVLDPNYATAWFGKGYSLDELNRNEEALTAYEQAIVLDPSDAGAWFNKGNSLLRLNREEKALAAYEQALVLDPNYATAWFGKGVSLANLNHNEQALTAYEQAILLDPVDAAVWFNKGNSLLRLNREDKALAAYEQALVLDPSDAATWFNKGYSLHRLSRYEEALSAFDQAQKCGTSDPSPYYANGLCLHELERFDEALLSFDLAIGLDKTQGIYSLSRIVTLLHLDRWTEALGALETVLPLLKDEAAELSDSTTSVVRRLLTGNQTLWLERSEALMRIYSQQQSVLILGQALTTTLPNLKSPLISPAARQLWLETWQKTAGEILEMRLPLHLLDTAIRYIDSGDPPDSRILLELPIEERSILETHINDTQNPAQRSALLKDAPD